MANLKRGRLFLEFYHSKMLWNNPTDLMSHGMNHINVWERDMAFGLWTLWSRLEERHTSKEISITHCSELPLQSKKKLWTPQTQFSTWNSRENKMDNSYEWTLTYFSPSPSLLDRLKILFLPMVMLFEAWRQGSSPSLSLALVAKH